MTRNPSVRVPPQSIEAEQAVLGGIMLAPDAFDRVGDKLTEDDFYRRDHRLIYRAIGDLSRRGQPFDAVTVGEWFEANGLSEMIAGGAYLIDLASNTPSAANIAAYAKIVRDKSILRQAIDIGSQLVETAFKPNGSDSASILDDAIRALMALHKAEESHEHTLKAAVSAAFAKAQEASEAGGKLMGIPTGIPKVDARLGGWNDSDLILIGARPAMGKEQPNSALVLTTRGFVRMGEIRVGDELASVDGAPSTVSGVYPQGVKDVYEFTFSDGRTARAGMDHLWEVNYRSWSAPRIKNTGEILELLKRKRYRNRLSVRLVSGDFGQRSELPIDPWLLGLLLGDGNFTISTPRFASADHEIVERVRSLLPAGYKLAQSGKYDYRISGRKGASNWLADALRGLGLWGCYSHEKRIPSSYMSSERATRLDLLRGLIDSDGWVESFNAVRFAASSIEFAEDVRQLAMSLGCIASISRRRTTHRDSYVLNIRHTNARDLCWLSRKKDRIRDRRHALNLTIRGVELVGREESTCIQVTHPSRLYVTDNYVVTHNTALMVNFADAAAAAGHTVGVVSGEMSALQYGQRAISMSSNVPAELMRNGQFKEEDWPKLQAAARLLNSRQMRLYDRSAPTIEEVQRVARRWRQELGIGILYIDYLQRIRVRGMSNRAEEVGEAARCLKDLARDLNIPVVCLAQVVRAVEVREDKRPGAGDLANSDEATREADQILMLYRDEVYNDNTSERGLAELNCEKNRHGPTGQFILRFDGPTMTFSDMKETF
jgi:replicative DNA helicase